MTRRLQRFLGFVVLLTAVLTLAPRPAAQAQDSTGTTSRVSVSSGGGQGNSGSESSALSADGRYVAFISSATNLVPGDTNGYKDVFVHDRQVGATSLVSVSSAGAQGNALGWEIAISADGRYVAFDSNASNLIAGDTNGIDDVFVHDRQTWVTSRVSVSSGGAQGNGRSGDPALSADGRFVAFSSGAPNLIAEDTNDAPDVFVHDRQTGATSLVSVSSGGGQGNSASESSALSADGRYVAFISSATNLVAGDTNGYTDVFVHDRQTGVTSRVSVSSGGAQGNYESRYPAFSANGRYVTFMSYATNLVAGDTNGDADVFVHDRQTGATSRVSVSSGGVQGNSGSSGPVLSADGRFVAFMSNASNFVAEDTLGSFDIFVHDRQTGVTSRVSVSSGGAQGNNLSYAPVLSADGRYVAFDSYASNLVAGDTNGSRDVFVHDRNGGGTASYAIAGGVRDQGVAPVAGVAVCTHTGACATSDTAGAYRITNLAAGSYTLRATKVGYTFTPTTRSVSVPPSAAGVDFTAVSTGTVPTAILQEAQSLVDSSDAVLAGAEDDALGVIEEVVYFRGAVPNFSIKFASTLFTGLLDMLKMSATNTDDLPVDMAFPGWKGTVLKSNAFCKLSNAFVNDVSGAAFAEHESVKRLTRLALNWGIYALAAYHENECLGDLREDLILDSLAIGNLLLAHLERPFAQTAVAQEIADARTYLDQQMSSLRAAKVPPMNQTTISSYVTDLRARKGANGVYQDQLHDALMTLQNVHAANEADPWGGDMLQLVLRSSAQFGAEWVAGSTGRAAVEGTLDVFDLYMNGNALIESDRMLLIANSTLLKTAPEVVQQVTGNTNKGLARIAAGQAPVTPRGSILGVEHYSGGKYLDPLALWWQERESYSWVTIKNTGATVTDFYVVGRYLGETTRLTLPWATLWLRASSDPVQLLPGQSTPVRLTYRDGGLGYSPREARTIANIPASDISVALLATNDTGTYHLDFDASEWQPARAVTANDLITFVEPSSETGAAVVDEVLVGAINSGPGQAHQKGFIWVNNPFETSVPIAVTQPLPANVTVLDSGGGSVDANGISWSGIVGPLETGFFTYTMVIDSPPGTVVTFPAATLDLTDPDTQILTIAGEAQAITMPWPVLIDRDTPDWIPPHTAATVAIRAANFAAEPVDGAFAVEVVTAAGQQVGRWEEPLAVAAEADQHLTFAWPDTLDIGEYEVRGFLILGGNEGQVFADPVAVGAPPPRLTLSVSPINDDGTVALGGVLDFAFTLENRGDMALTDVVAGITLPTDVEILAISNGGARSGAEIQWPLSTLAAGATRTLTVKARVPLGFVAPNQGRYLESTPFLTATESPDATGATLTVLVLGPEGDPAPSLTGFTPTSGLAGTSVTISGTNLTTAIVVTFNGTPASAFTVISAARIDVTVPAGATTGKIAVTTSGGTATSTADFTVLTPLMAAFSANRTSGSPPLTVAFSDASAGQPTSWWWNFGDDQTSTAVNPIHTYNDAGIYTVSLTVSNASGSDTETKTGYIHVGAVARRLFLPYISSLVGSER